MKRRKDKSREIPLLPYWPMYWNNIGKRRKTRRHGLHPIVLSGVCRSYPQRVRGGGGLDIRRRRRSRARRLIVHAVCLALVGDVHLNRVACDLVRSVVPRGKGLSEVASPAVLRWNMTTLVAAVFLVTIMDVSVLMARLWEVTIPSESVLTGECVFAHMASPRL